MSRVKQARVRLYFDADALGLAHVMSGLRPDVTCPGDPGGVVHKRRRPPCVITTPNTPDDVWIPKVAADGLLIITRDGRIQTRRREIQAVREHSARMVALTGEDASGVFGRLEVLMCRWRGILRCLDESGPFIYAVTRTTFRPIDLDR